MFRVEDKENVRLNDQPHTACNIFQQKSDGSFIHIEKAFVAGWDLSDDEVLERWSDQTEDGT